MHMLKCVMPSRICVGYTSVVTGLLPYNCYMPMKVSLAMTLHVMVRMFHFTKYYNYWFSKRRSTDHLVL